jgi:hypothetical protein
MRCRTGTNGHHSRTALGRTCDGEGYLGVHQAGGSGEATGPGSSSQARDLRGRVTQI